MTSKRTNPGRSGGRRRRRRRGRTNERERVPSNTETGDTRALPTPDDQEEQPIQAGSSANSNEPVTHTADIPAESDPQVPPEMEDSWVISYLGGLAASSYIRLPIETLTTTRNDSSDNVRDLATGALTDNSSSEGATNTLERQDSNPAGRAKGERSDSDQDRLQVWEELGKSATTAFHVVRSEDAEVDQILIEVTRDFVEEIGTVLRDAMRPDEEDGMAYIVRETTSNEKDLPMARRVRATLLEAEEGRITHALHTVMTAQDQRVDVALRDYMGHRDEQRGLSMWRNVLRTDMNSVLQSLWEVWTDEQDRQRAEDGELGTDEEYQSLRSARISIRDAEPDMLNRAFIAAVGPHDSDVPPPSNRPFDWGNAASRRIEKLEDFRVEPTDEPLRTVTKVRDEISEYLDEADLLTSNESSSAETDSSIEVIPDESSEGRSTSTSSPSDLETMIDREEQEFMPRDEEEREEEDCQRIERSLRLTLSLHQTLTVHQPPRDSPRPDNAATGSVDQGPSGSEAGYARAREDTTRRALPEGHQAEGRGRREETEPWVAPDLSSGNVTEEQQRRVEELIADAMDEYYPGDPKHQ